MPFFARESMLGVCDCVCECECDCECECEGDELRVLLLLANVPTSL